MSEKISRVQNLPEDIKDVMFSMDTADAIQAIGKKHGLMIDKIGELNEEIGNVMIGEVRAEHFQKALTARLQIPEQKAAAIVKDVDEEIFKPIRESLKKINGDSSSKTAPENPIKLTPVPVSDLAVGVQKQPSPMDGASSPLTRREAAPMPPRPTQTAPAPQPVPAPTMPPAAKPAGMPGGATPAASAPGRPAPGKPPIPLSFDESAPGLHVPPAQPKQMVPERPAASMPIAQSKLQSALQSALSGNPLEAKLSGLTRTGVEVKTVKPISGAEQRPQTPPPASQKPEARGMKDPYREPIDTP